MRETPATHERPAVVESSNIARDPERGTEDRLVIGRGVYAVLDGVSNRTGQKDFASGDSAPQTPGQFASRIGASALLSIGRRIEDGEISDASVIPRMLTDALRQSLPRGYTGFPPEFVLAAYFPRLKAVLQIGDVSIRFAGEKPADTRARNPGLLIDGWRMSARSEGSDVPIEAQRQHENRTTHLGYGVVSADPSVPHIPPIHARIIGVPEGTTVIMCSDGYRIELIRDTLEETEAAYAAYRSLRPDERADDRSYLSVRAS